MRRPNLGSSNSGFTLVELCVAMGVLVLVGMIVYAVLINSTTLLAKNVSLNETNLILRTALDRVYAEVNQANGLPKLINADGSAASTNGPAAGVIFDRFLGGPYVVVKQGTGLPANAQTFQMKRSTHALASPPNPKVNDVVQIDGTTRPLVSSATAGGQSGIETLTVNLQAPIGKSITWPSTTEQTAFLVHRQAFVVASVNGRGELRYYKDAETVTNYSNSASYLVLNREIGTKSDEETKPFTLVTQNGVQFLNISMRIENQTYNRALAARQGQEFNTFLRVDTLMRPRNFL